MDFNLIDLTVLSTEELVELANKSLSHLYVDLVEIDENDEKEISIESLFAEADRIMDKDIYKDWA